MSALDREVSIGFVGGGNIAKAFVDGFINYGSIKAGKIFVSDRTTSCLQHYDKLGCATTNCNQDLIDKFHCEIIFLCLKPNIIKKFTNEYPVLNIKHANEKSHTAIISVIAGFTVEQLSKTIVGQNYSIHRIMPNIACSVGEGVFGLAENYFSEKHSSNFNQTSVVQLLSRIGVCEILPESLLDAVTGIAGSGIAFGYTIIQAMSDGGVKMGLPRDIATKFALQTLKGAAKTVEKSGKHPIELRDSVCSPGGTTIYGLHVLERTAVASGLIDAVEAATLKSKSFSQQ